MSNELEVRQPRGQNATLPAKVQYAKCLADSGLLPAQYRKAPANVLWAMEYADMLGLSAMAAITGVHVIEGKPTASAGLISALVRRAGHKLRVKGDDRQATAQIIRSDDPDYTYEVTWTLERAKTAELLGKGNWKKYPAAMLKARAITEVARDACEEALFGLHYTPEELGAEVDEEGNVVGGPAEGEPRPPAPPDAGPVQDATVVATDEDWFGNAQARAGRLATAGEVKGLWGEIGEMLRVGRCTKTDADRLADMISARAEELKNPAAPAPAGTLSEDDEWVIRIRDIVHRDECDPVRAEMAEVFRDHPGDDPRVVALYAELDAREAELSRGAAA